MWLNWSDDILVDENLMRRLMKASWGWPKCAPSRLKDLAGLLMTFPNCSRLRLPQQSWIYLSIEILITNWALVTWVGPLPPPQALNHSPPFHQATPRFVAMPAAPNGHSQYKSTWGISACFSLKKEISHVMIKKLPFQMSFNLKVKNRRIKDRSWLWNLNPRPCSRCGHSLGSVL